MKYTSKTFSVAAPGTKTYRDNWERTFRSLCGATFPNSEARCQLPAGHEGYHVGHADNLELRITQTTGAS